ncbi:IS5 family transposase [Paenibacillus durus]|uniref:Transposase n=1 Tax=Paenibacillus durus TaxID=44251 RepID=A0A089HW14_PAEDU|nr:IS5 family transposase [Paenibacillus durus]AIQ14548.1 transposase [Paenibacillus durus]AIQ14716.1 transposase [Paenibacillus durus]
MFERIESTDDLLKDFYLPFGGKLNPNNRWVKLAKLVPWEQAEEKYVKVFGAPDEGQKAYSVRLALGSLLIKERLGLTDRETTLQIMENPYLQYFLGFGGYVDKEPFHHSLMTHFRDRLGPDILHEINDWIIKEGLKAEQEAAKAAAKAKEQTRDDDDDHPGGGQMVMKMDDTLTILEVDTTPEKSQQKGKAKSLFRLLPNPDAQTHRGTLMLDATCAPADIKYPTDLGLLNHAREILEGIIDALHQPLIGLAEKPRTYRRQARKAYLLVSKQRQPKGKTIRKAVKKQLGYVGRDLRIIENLSQQTSLSTLSKMTYRRLLVIRELHRQQQEMMNGGVHRVEHRIVSIEQPHVRPIVRGKAGASVEFGAKIAASLSNGYAWIETMQWDNFNESGTLQDAVKSYKERFGAYPAVILADKIYRNRENLAYCKGVGIRLSGPKLGRPSTENQATHRKQERQDAAERNAIEGKFGEGKRRYGLGLIRAKGAARSLTVIALSFMVMNLERRLRALFVHFFGWIFYRPLTGC